MIPGLLGHLNIIVIIACTISLCTTSVPYATKSFVGRSQSFVLCYAINSISLIARGYLQNWCSYRMGGWTNFGQNLDKCPIFVQGLSKVCPKLQNVLLLSNNFQISGQMSKFYISFVQDLSNFLPLSKLFWLYL